MKKQIWKLIATLGLIAVIFLQFNIKVSPQTQEGSYSLTHPSLTQQLAYVAFLQTIKDDTGNSMDVEKMTIRQSELACMPLYKLKKICEPADFTDQEEKEEPQKKPTVDAIKKKKVALTFDDGPHPKVTERILAVLRQYDIPATFFVIGQNVEKYPQIVQQAADEGHEIANHSWSHRNLTKIPNDQVLVELNQTNEAIYKATGKYPSMYRPPYGATNANVRSLTSMETVMWNVDTLDWKHRTPEKTLAYVKEQVKDNGIILMHDIHSETADALEAVINYLIEQNYEFVTASELLE
ncbi:polysaccharide deacetylase family protein [Solibacillus sp. FSL K6-1523]|uniref:polysaccharide deacetylase family protein n=1 Tax=Solibacillus sp. FSL K6-1523 TaxID=2921471 RepID=UPI0030FBABCA